MRWCSTEPMWHRTGTGRRTAPCPAGSVSTSWLVGGEIEPYADGTHEVIEHTTRPSRGAAQDLGELSGRRRRTRTTTRPMRQSRTGSWADPTADAVSRPAGQETPLNIKATTSRKDRAPWASTWTASGPLAAPRTPTPNTSVERASGAVDFILTAFPFCSGNGLRPDVNISSLRSAQGSRRARLCRRAHSGAA